jgi:hypothetical protein
VGGLLPNAAKMTDDGTQIDHHLKYEAITERNLEALKRLQRLRAKSAWSKWYEPIHPRDLSARLINAFRVGILPEYGAPKLEPASGSVALPGRWLMR